MQNDYARDEREEENGQRVQEGACGTTVKDWRAYRHDKHLRDSARPSSPYLSRFRELSEPLRSCRLEGSMGGFLIDNDSGRVAASVIRSVT